MAPRNAGDDFGRSYREERHLSSHDQPVIVRTLEEAYVPLELTDPRFEPLVKA